MHNSEFVKRIRHFHPRAMAVAFLIASASEVDQFVPMAFDIAQRLDQPLAVLYPASEPEPSPAPKSAKRESKDAADTAAESSLPRFRVRTSFAELLEQAIQQHLHEHPTTPIQVATFEIPRDAVEIRHWINDPPETESFGRFRVETFFIPQRRGESDEAVYLAKNRLFETLPCETVYLAVNDDQAAPLPLAKIGSGGSSQPGENVARRLARRLSLQRPAHVDLTNRDPELNCLILGISGKASQTRIDNNKTWNEWRKDRELPVAMVVNPADSMLDRHLWELDNWIRVVFADYQMNRADREKLSGELTEGTRHSPEFILFIGISTLLACVGLLQDAPAVVIGAMLVAPLMTPLLGAGLAMIQGNRPLFLTAMRATVTGSLIAFFIGLLVGCLSLSVPAGLFPDSQLRLTGQMISRSHPNILDPLIGLAGGLAGGFAVGRDKKIGALAGVAIAAALVPPLATSGLEAVIVVAATVMVGSPAVLFELVTSDPADVLARTELIVDDPGPTDTVRLVFAPLALFLMNACAVILGAYVGMRLVGMHRTTFPKESKQWVTVAGIVLLLAVIFLLMAIPLVAFYA